MSIEKQQSNSTCDETGNEQQVLDANREERASNSRITKKKAATKVKPSVFFSKAQLKSQAKLATTQQLRDTYEHLGIILLEREEADAEQLRVEREQTEAAQALLEQAALSGIPMDILKKVMGH